MMCLRSRYDRAGQACLRQVSEADLRSSKIGTVEPGPFIRNDTIQMAVLKPDVGEIATRQVSF